MSIGPAGNQAVFDYVTLLLGLNGRYIEGKLKRGLLH